MNWYGEEARTGISAERAAAGQLPLAGADFDHFRVGEPRQFSRGRFVKATLRRSKFGSLGGEPGSLGGLDFRDRHRKGGNPLFQVEMLVC